MWHAFLFLLVSLSFFPLSSGAHTAEHGFSEKITEPPEQHEEWQGSIGALWVQYPLDCAVWEEQGKRTFHCHRDGDTVNLTIHPSSDPLLSLQGMVLGKMAEARAVQKGDLLDVSGTYDDQTSSLPLTIDGTAETFTFSGSYDGTPFQGKGSYLRDSLTVSLSLTKTFPVTGTLTLHRSDGTLPSSLSPLIESPPSTATGTLPPPASNLPTFVPPVLPLLSSGTIEGATQRVVEQVQESGQALTKFSHVLTLVFQAIFAVLVLFVLLTFGFLLHRLKSQQTKSPPPASPAPHNTLPSKDSPPPHP